MAKGRHMRAHRRLAVALIVGGGLLVTLSADVLAIIGRPATPVSYAGVARRTVRRTVP